MLLTFGFFLILFLSFPETNLAVRKRPLSKTKPAHVCISSDFCRLLITYANSLDPDQDQWQVRIACALILMGKKINFFNDRHKIIANNIIKSRDKFLWELY